MFSWSFYVVNCLTYIDKSNERHVICKIYLEIYFQMLIYNTWISNETLVWKNNLQIKSLV